MQKSYIIFLKNNPTCISGVAEEESILELDRELNKKFRFKSMFKLYDMEGCLTIKLSDVIALSIFDMNEYVSNPIGFIREKEVSYE